MHTKNDLLSPDFLVVGAHKCGTTSLYATLADHPEIQGLATKEPHFFCHSAVSQSIPDVVCDIESYTSLFIAAKKEHGVNTYSEQRKEKLLGEASVFYLYYHDEAIRNIKKYCGDQVKIIITVRNPIERAYSAYMDEVSKDELEKLSFLEALKSENERVENQEVPPSMHYTSVGHYSDMISNYKNNFPNILVLTFEETIKDQPSALRKVQNFLEIDEKEISLARENIGRRTWKNRRVGNILKSIVPRHKRSGLKNTFPRAYSTLVKFVQKIMYVPVKEMDLDSRNYLEKHFAEELTELKNLHNISF